jgi:hypothetical protein
MKVYAVDLDNTLCISPKGGFWNKPVLEDLPPIPKMIDWVNQKYAEGHTIIIYTARPRRFYEITESWLIKNQVYYHALRMGKLRADYYVDDKALNVKDCC